MPSFSGQANAPGLALVAELLQQLIKNGPDVRTLQAQNAPKAVYFIGNTGNTGPRSNTGTSVDLIELAQPGDPIFSGMTVFVETSSGKGRYTIHGIPPTAAGYGIEIPSGGTIIDLEGMENIKNFRLIAETGFTVSYYALLYR